MATDTQLRFLQKLAKGSKGAFDPVVAEQTLPLLGFSMSTQPIAYDVAKHTSGNHVVENMLKDWAQSYAVRYISQPSRAEKWEFWLNEPNAEEAASALRELARIVDVAPEHPEPGVLYMTEPSTSRKEIKIDKVWLGTIGFAIEAPSGASTLAPWPISMRGQPTPAPITSPSFWTFVYKQGAKQAAADYLARQEPEAIAAATASKAERERIVRRRSAMPEIEALFLSVTEQRYPQVVAWLRQLYLDQVDQVEQRRDAQGDIPYKVWSMFPLARRFFRQEYTSKGLRWELRPDYEKMALDIATTAADAAREAFVEKNTFRISEIAKAKGAVPTATLLSVEEGPSFNSRIRFAFPDGSGFELRNKTVWKRSPNGIYFAQFPTTFHDVVLPSGKKMPKPSEARMLDVFAKANETPMRRTAARLARGE